MSPDTARERIEKYRRALRRRINHNRDAFTGKYADEIEGLMGLSRDEIDALTPGTADLETYANLISIVKEASAANIAQAELVRQIQNLGELGVAIARKVPLLAEMNGL